jgi:hypothetical protein
MLVRVFLIFFFLNYSSLANEFYQTNQKNINCNKELEFNPKQDILEVNILNNKKWVENLLKVLVEFNHPDSKTGDSGVFNFRIKDRYKKFFKSKVLIKYKEQNLICKFDAKVKITGDGWWHLDWINGEPFASIQVRLLDGNINNVVNFKLLLPRSRKSDNEIFITSIFKYLNFISPKTFYTDVKINNFKTKYIFQEHLAKELLESHSLVEGPIIEGDERFTIEKKLNNQSFYPLSMSRISNSKYIKNDLSKMKKSLEAISYMNEIYIQSHLSYPESFGKSMFATEKLKINSKSIDNLFEKNFDTYESIIYAMGAAHGQSHDDRRFYYDPINNFFKPIYYDGKPSIIDYYKKTKKSKNSDDSLKLENLKNIISKEAVDGAKKAIILINNIDNNNFLKILDQNGLSLTLEDLKNIKDIIIRRLEAFKNISTESLEQKTNVSYFERLESKKDYINLVFIDIDKKTIEICNYNLSDCKIQTLDLNYLESIYAQRFDFLDNKDNNQIYLFVGNDKKFNFKNLNNFKKIDINENFSVKYNKMISLNIDNENKNLTIRQNDQTGRVVISGKIINNWKIIFIGDESNQIKNVIKNYENLTGCLTFVDITLKNLSLSSKNSKCEDSINLIRTKGNIAEIIIKDSKYDGIDADFSTLKIKDLKVENSGNDCLDFSFGQYEIENIDLKKCADKGISVGEKSNAYFNIVNIQETNIGIASKDSSLIEANNVNIINTKTCVSAYKKKQEFNFADIKIDKMNCYNFKKEFLKDKGSTINIKNL